jgi:hypothetical protein
LVLLLNAPTNDYDRTHYDNNYYLYNHVLDWN